MNNRWTVQTERGDHSACAVWAVVEEASGRKTTAIVLNTDSKAAVVVLASGMFFLKGPGIAESVLFRIESSSRARMKGCMFIKAVEVADVVRLRENSILQEMRKLLELDMIEVGPESQSVSFQTTFAS
ncbi:MAG: hypothetical protein J7K88_06015 [Candidatus Fermentibacteraceae bacterium]|nr:hypothetical protein [Candidatus Fermentibacteraceae bacterium]